MQIVHTTVDHDLPDGSVTLLGAVRTVTGAMTRVDAGGRSLLVDCGIAQGRAAREWSFPDAAHDVHAVVLTHGHADHVGSVPVLLEAGFDRPILGTRATLDLAAMNLRDTVRFGGGSNRDAARVVQRFKQLARALRYDVPTRPFDDWDGVVTMREAGHIIGSASVELHTSQSRVIISGDLGRPDSPLLRDYHTSWEAERPVDLVVMESTYGSRDHHATHDRVRAELKRIIYSAMEDGGHILVPAFAIGRTQVLLCHLNALVEAGELPHMPVAVDTPMGLRVTDVYNRSQGLFDRESLERLERGDDPLDFDHLYRVDKHEHSAMLRMVREPMMVIAGSGMCTGGRIVGHLKELLPVRETCVLFVGYQAAGTPGRAIVDAAQQREHGSIPTVRIDGEDVPVRAQVEVLSGLSAHADRTELARWLDAIPGVRRVALHHGEPQAQRDLVAWLERRQPHS